MLIQLQKYETLVNLLTYP